MKKTKKPARAHRAERAWSFKVRLPARKLAMRTPGGRAVNPTVVPGVKLLAMGCKGKRGPKPRGASELVFLQPDAARKAGLRTGAALRLCTGVKGGGYLVNVASSSDATAKAHRWAKCAAGAKTKTGLQACVRKAKG